jgi:hypothetical protein
LATKKYLKIIRDSHSKALATYLDVLVNGGVDMGVALSEVTNTKEGSPRVRYMENERKKIFKPVIRTILGKDVECEPAQLGKIPTAIHGGGGYLQPSHVARGSVLYFHQE